MFGKTRRNIFMKREECVVRGLGGSMLTEGYMLRDVLFSFILVVNHIL